MINQYSVISTPCRLLLLYAFYFLLYSARNKKHPEGVFCFTVFFFFHGTPDEPL
ncbi:MAG: hypothetical protein UY00_C0013G0002 [Candidatus Wolfebacteria bacterium GW2011_GWA1_47_6]|nr:MAG: hypothetical protein UY00_C0013G0002 [Candidatus Wolfebacteria bacterium GW2011_GWA1_47_6]